LGLNRAIPRRTRAQTLANEAADRQQRQNATTITVTICADCPRNNETQSP